MCLALKKPFIFPSCEAEAKKKLRLYKDDYCILEENKLILKNFYFPTLQSKKINLENIEAVYYIKQNGPNEICRVASWGTSGTPIWWARDFNRSVKRCHKMFYHVIIENGEAYMKGFTVRDIQSFLHELHMLIPKVENFVNDFPL
ncbi:unnamed protein product [Auanema sp. JU1783]|nr:unnamed protein product [Auanema sp. JU1783]